MRIYFLIQKHLGLTSIFSFRWELNQYFFFRLCIRVSGAIYTWTCITKECVENGPYSIFDADGQNWQFAFSSIYIFHTAIEKKIGPIILIRVNLFRLFSYLSFFFSCFTLLLHRIIVRRTYKPIVFFSLYFISIVMQSFHI